MHAVALAGDAAAHHVGDGDDLRPALARLAHSGERVGGLSRLGDRHDERLVVDDRIVVAELEETCTSTGIRAHCSMRDLGDEPAW
jgi:hypothetical protein